MKCCVCFASFAQGQKCPNCGYDHAAPDAKELARITEAREAFRARTLAYAPETRVSAFDKARPWIGLGIGLVLFFVWLRACSSIF
jgi:hypothetical protein